MALKFTVDKLEDVPEAQRSLYTEKDGKFLLDVSGAVSSDKLNEFRENNTRLLQERDQLNEQFKGIDPAAARAALNQAQQLKDKKLIEEGKIDELIEQRVGAMKQEHQRLVDGLKNENGVLSVRLGGLLIDSAIREEALKAGVRSTAVDDVLNRGRGVFRLKDGHAVAMEGDKPLFGTSGDPLQVPEFVGGLLKTAPHLFEPSKGGSAPGSGGGAGAGGDKTMTRTAWQQLSPDKRAEAAKTHTLVDA